jgi:hypothetical protein
MGVERWLIIDADGVAQNVVMWDADANPDWSPPEGCTVIPDDGRDFSPAQDQQPTTNDTMDVLLQAVKALAVNKRADATSILSALNLDPTE